MFGFMDIWDCFNYHYYNSSAREYFILFLPYQYSEFFQFIKMKMVSHLFLISTYQNYNFNSVILFGIYLNYLIL